MGISRFKKKSINRFIRPRLSIEQRLPLLIFILLLCCILVFSWTSYLGVKKAALSVGRERLNTLTKQLTAMFQQSTNNMAYATRKTANEESVKKHLLSGGKESNLETLQLIQTLNKDTQSASIELLDANRKSILYSNKGNLDLKINIDSLLVVLAGSHDSSLVGKIYLHGDSM